MCWLWGLVTVVRPISKLEVTQRLRSNSFQECFEKPWHKYDIPKVIISPIWVFWVPWAPCEEEIYSRMAVKTWKSLAQVMLSRHKEWIQSKRRLRVKGGSPGLMRWYCMDTARNCGWEKAIVVTLWARSLGSKYLSSIHCAQVPLVWPITFFQYYQHAASTTCYGPLFTVRRKPF